MAGGFVSGRYRGSGDVFEVQLRVDVDGPNPTHHLSADYFRTAGGETRYVGSMLIAAPVVEVSDRQLMISGTGTFSFSTKFDRVTVTIPIAPPGSARAAATLGHMASSGASGPTYECQFESASLRTVDLEEAVEQGVTPFHAYDTAALPARESRRRLTHIQAFADAGIEMRPTGPPTAIEMSEAGANATWSDAELQAAMQEHFSRWGDHPRWAIWLLHAASHDDPLIQGLLFDQSGLQRQGCAVFYGHGASASAETRRRQLHTCVHELGHGFNLLHCWQKSLTEPPLPSRPRAATWMNYPEYFPGGEAAFWPAFRFRFDDPELVFLRHAFEPDVIMGGAPFAATAADRRRGWDVDDLRDPGLELELTAPDALVQEVPVTVRLDLSVTNRGARSVPATLGPRAGTVDIAIRTPGGDESVFEPLLSHCRGEDLITLSSDEPPLTDWAFIHFGRKGFAFDRPGRYLVRARFSPPDGPVVLSNVASIDVTAPVTRADRLIASLIGGDEQVGTLMSVMGSDAPALQRGNDKLQEIIKAYPAEPLGAVARLVHAANIARGFKRVEPDGNVTVRAPRTDEAAALVADIVDFRRTALAAGDLGGQIQLQPGVDAAVGGLANSRPGDVLRTTPGVTTPPPRQAGAAAATNSGVPAGGRTSSSGSGRRAGAATGSGRRGGPTNAPGGRAGAAGSRTGKTVAPARTGSAARPPRSGA